MTKIKNNKVFIFLFVILLSIMAVLSYRLIVPANDNNFNLNKDEPSKVAQITNLYGRFSDSRLAVEISWGIHPGNKKVKNVSLFYDDKKLKDVNDVRSLSLPIAENDIETGNHKFDLLVDFEDESSLSKTIYIYIDEAYNFSVSSQNSETKSTYTVTYYYDKRRPVQAPTVRFTGSSSAFTINYISSKIVEEKDNKVKMQAEYELLYNNAKRGDYALNFVFSFPEYNLELDDYTASFRIASTEENVE